MYTPVARRSYVYPYIGTCIHRWTQAPSTTGFYEKSLAFADIFGFFIRIFLRCGGEPRIKNYFDLPSVDAFMCLEATPSLHPPCVSLIHIFFCLFPPFSRSYSTGCCCCRVSHKAHLDLGACVPPLLVYVYAI